MSLVILFKSSFSLFILCKSFTSHVTVLFQLISILGGVLTERTVGDVLPALEGQIENIGNVIKMIEEKMSEKAKEITSYREKHQILVQGMSKAGPAQGAGGGKSGVLVQ